MMLSLRWFIQLNPARGRKLVPVLSGAANLCAPVYAAQPREGTETISTSRESMESHDSVYAS